MVCPRGKAILPSNTYFTNHKCGDYTCDGYKSFTIKVNKNTAATEWETVTCTKDNATDEFSLPYDNNQPRKVSCVDPERFCRTMKLYDLKGSVRFVADPFDPNTTQLPEITPEREDEGNRGDTTDTGDKGDTTDPNGNGNTKESGGGTGSEDKAKEEEAKKKKVIIITSCVTVIALIVIAAVVVFVVYWVKKSKENAYNDDSDANYAV